MRVQIILPPFAQNRVIQLDERNIISYLMSNSILNLVKQNIFSIQIKNSSKNKLIHGRIITKTNSRFHSSNHQTSIFRNSDIG